MQENELIYVISALENNNKSVVVEYLKNKWETGVDDFILTIAEMREINPVLVDKYINSNEIINGFFH